MAAPPELDVEDLIVREPARLGSDHGALMDPTDLPFVVMEARERPMHVGGLQLFTAPADADRDYLRGIYENAIASRDELHPLLRRRPGRSPIVGRYQWEDDDRIDLGYHVRHTGLPRPGRIRELLEVVGRLHGTLLDRNRPLWEAHLIEGLDDGRFAVYTKVHHALLDGVSAMRLLSDALSTDADERDMPPPWAARTRVRQSRGDDLLHRRLATPGSKRWWPAAISTAAGLARFGYDTVAVGSRLARSIHDGLATEAAVLPYQAPPSDAERAHHRRPPLRGPVVVPRPHEGGRDTPRRHPQRRRPRHVRRRSASLPARSRRPPRHAADRHGAGLAAKAPPTGRWNAVGVILADLATHTASAAERFALAKASMDAGKARFAGLRPCR